MIKEQQVPMETILCRCEKTISLEQKHSGQASLSKCYLTFRLEGQDLAKPGNHSGKSIPDKSTEATGTGWMSKTEKFSPKLKHKEEERKKWKLREVNNRRPQKSFKE